MDPFRLSAVTLYPQPLAPVAGSRFNAVLLNPQPLPPRSVSRPLTGGIIIVGG